MNITVLTTRLFGQPANGGEACTARLLAALRQGGHRLRLIGRGPAAAAAALADDCLSLGPLVPAFDDWPRHRRLASVAAMLARQQASTVQRLAANGAAQQARQALLGPGAPPLDVLVVDHLQAWAWIDAVSHRLPPPLLVMHNLETAGYAEQAAAASGARRWLLQREADLLAPLERRALDRSASVACLSEADAAHFERQLQAQGPADRGRRVEVLPGYPLGRPVEVPAASAAGRPAGRRIGLLGTWTWGPNRAALQWMVDQVLPRLPADCRLVLAGAGLAGQVWPARVQALGRIDDLADFYRSVDVVALPAHHGSGVQEKAIEAIASGRPVVATPHALRGLYPVPPQVWVADEAQHFAQTCARAGAGDAPEPAAVRAWSAARQARYRQALERCLLAASAASPVARRACSA